MTTWQRARQPEQKDERRAAILAAAATLIEERGLAGLSVQAVAKRAGLGKATLYHYFRTKEEIFLHLYREEVGDWAGAAADALLALPADDDPHATAAALVEAWGARPRFCRLTAGLAVAIERNVPAETLRSFKLGLLPILGGVDEALAVALPSLTAAQRRGLFTAQHALVAGLWPLSTPCPEMKAALDHPDLAAMKHEFLPAMRHSLGWMIRGMLAAE